MPGFERSSAERCRGSSAQVPISDARGNALSRCESRRAIDTREDLEAKFGKLAERDCDRACQAQIPPCDTASRTQVSRNFSGTRELNLNTMPTDSALETGLRDAVRSLYDDPDLSIKRVRAKAEEDLGLESGFFKGDSWKEKSKEIIEDQFERRDEEQKSSKKRSSPVGRDGGRARKKSRVEEVVSEEEDESTALSDAPESEEDLEDSASEVEETPKKKRQQGKAAKGAQKPAKQVKKSAPKKETAKTNAKPKPKPTKKASSESELSDAPSEVPEESDNGVQPPAKPQQEEDDSSSELSSVIDDPEPVRKKSKSSKARNGDAKPPTKQRKSSTSSTKPKPPAETDPSAEEIKRLQSWLVKCGIRKVWGKELKPFNTPRAKISHLRALLADVGMTGRYSNEKAAQIKEARELAADIEAVKEGNERWGKGSGDEGDGDGEGDEDSASGRPKRRLVRGAANYDFLSSDGEETD